MCVKCNKNKIGQAEINIFSHFSIFFLQNGIKVYIFLILRSSRFQISNLFLATTTLGASRQKVASGVNFEPPFWIEVITGSGSNSIPLPTFPWTTWWKKNFSFSIKIEGVTVPAHFLQNGGCDVIQMKFSKNEKKATGKSLPDPSCVEICPEV